MSEQQAVRYPRARVELDLKGPDGNAFVILGSVAIALRNLGVAEKEVKAFRAEAMAGDYDHLLATARRWVQVTER